MRDVNMNIHQGKAKAHLSKKKNQLPPHLVNAASHSSTEFSKLDPYIHPRYVDPELAELMK
jgi:hypothetical protein